MKFRSGSMRECDVKFLFLYPSHKHQGQDRSTFRFLFHSLRTPFPFPSLSFSSSLVSRDHQRCRRLIRRLLLRRDKRFLISHRRVKIQSLKLRKKILYAKVLCEEAHVKHSHIVCIIIRKTLSAHFRRRFRCRHHADVKSHRARTQK